MAFCRGHWRRDMAGLHLATARQIHAPPRPQERPPPVVAHPQAHPALDGCNVGPRCTDSRDSNSGHRRNRRLHNPALYRLDHCRSPHPPVRRAPRNPRLTRGAQALAPPQTAVDWTHMVHGDRHVARLDGHQQYVYGRNNLVSDRLRKGFGDHGIDPALRPEGQKLGPPLP